VTAQLIISSPLDAERAQGEDLGMSDAPGLPASPRFGVTIACPRGGGLSAPQAAREAEDAAADELLRRSARWGIGSWCVHQPSRAAMAHVIEAVRS
jgi:hypothetical protein